MDEKIMNNKTTCNKMCKSCEIPVPARVTAVIANVSESYVKKIRKGHRSDNSPKAQLVRQCDTLLNGELNQLLTVVKDIINPE
jgi:hypothetical protein